jgi:hypothetical protein
LLPEVEDMLPLQKIVAAVKPAAHNAPLPDTLALLAKLQDLHGYVDTILRLADLEPLKDTDASRWTTVRRAVEDRSHALKETKAAAEAWRLGRDEASVSTVTSALSALAQVVSIQPVPALEIKSCLLEVEDRMKALEGFCAQMKASRVAAFEAMAARVSK